MLINYQKIGEYPTLKEFLKEFPADTYQTAFIELGTRGWEISLERIPELEDGFAWMRFKREGYSSETMLNTISTIAFSFLYDEENGYARDEFSEDNMFFCMLKNAPGRKLRFHSDTMEGVVWLRENNGGLTLRFRPVVKTNPWEYRVITDRYDLRFNYIDGEPLVCYDHFRDNVVTVPIRQYGSDAYHMYLGSSVYHICEFAEHSKNSYFLKRLVDMPGELFEVVTENQENISRKRLICVKGIVKDHLSA